MLKTPTGADDAAITWAGLVGHQGPEACLPTRCLGSQCCGTKQKKIYKQPRKMLFSFQFDQYSVCLCWFNNSNCFLKTIGKNTYIGIGN